MLQAPNSPLFPALTLSPAMSNVVGIDSLVAEDLLIPQLPDEPLTLTSSIQVYIIPAEKYLYVQGFDPREYAERPPALLRGCLYIRVLKPTKIKSISLTFKGQSKTDWPEGIPPKKNVYVDINDIVSHTWPFYQMENAIPNGGADMFIPPKSEQEITHLSLTETKSRNHSPMRQTTQPDNISLNHSNGGFGSSFFTRNLSPTAGFIRRTATSPSANINDHLDLTATMSAPDMDTNKPGHFPVGDYIYDFEHAIHPSVPETTDVTFGSVNYYLEADIIRIGTFKLNLTARLPVEIVRTPSELNLEENEPIVISRDWEDQLRYDIVVGGKSVVLNSYLPLALRFVPLWGKVALHRIRVYLTESLEYYCQNKKVHRMEPSKKFLLLEHKAKKGKSLLSKSGGLTTEPENPEDEEILPRELEFQLYVPKVLDDKFGHQIHPDTSFENIQSHHWIKICLRISKLDPDNPEKRKHYEISIDSPIHILSPLAAHGNTLLPAYDIHQEQFLPEYTPTSPPLSPDVTPVEGSLIGNIMAALGGSNRTRGHSLGTHNESSSISRSQSPNQFHHLNSTANNDEPIERDMDMHLGSNLYVPKEDEHDNPLHSPQALPHPGTFSSPLLQAQISSPPPLDPPPFIENNESGDKSEALPPAYEVEDPALSLSPLRIDDRPTTPTLKLDTSLHGSIPKPEINHNYIQVIPPTPSQETPIKDLLNQQLDQITHHNSKRKLTSSVKSNEGASDHLDTKVKSNKSSRRPSFDEEDIADSSIAPIQPPSPLQQALHFPSPRRQSVISQSRRSSVSSLGSSAFDELPVDQTLPLLNSSNISLVASNTNLSSSFGSIGSHIQNAANNKTSRSNSSTVPDKSRNSSVHSFFQDNNRRASNLQGLPTRLYDMVDGDLSDDTYRISGNLLQLRNPRIKKHYQIDAHNVDSTGKGGVSLQEKELEKGDPLEEQEAPKDVEKEEPVEGKEEDPSESIEEEKKEKDLEKSEVLNLDNDQEHLRHSSSQNTILHESVPSHMQLNDSEHSNRSSTSFESEVTVDESDGVRSKSDDSHSSRATSEAIPGFNYGYVIE